MPHQHQHHYGPFANGGDRRMNYMYAPEHANHHAYHPYGPNGQYHHGHPMQSAQYYQPENPNPHYSQNLDTDFPEQYGQPLTFNEQPIRQDGPDFDLQQYRSETPVPVGHRRGEGWRGPAKRRGHKDLTLAIEKVMAGMLDPRELEAYGACRQYAACNKIQITSHMAIEQLQDMLMWVQQDQQHMANMQYGEPVCRDYGQGYQDGYRGYSRRY